jgi:uncharacterized protein (UPF0276 family)
MSGGACAGRLQIDSGPYARPDCDAMTPSTTGIRLRPKYVREAISYPVRELWFEVRAEDYMTAKGWDLALLEELRAAGHEISLHDGGMSLAANTGPDLERAAALKRLVDRLEPKLVSEHLTWSRPDGRCLPDLLPVPRSNEVLARCAENIARVQDLLGRQILIENPTHYLDLRDHSWSETSFLSELSRRSNCGLLIDVNNVAIGSHNTGFVASEWLDAIPAGRVGGIHLGGHSLDFGGTLLVRSDDAPVSDQVWELYRQFVDRIGPRPTSIEHGGKVPSFSELMRERAHAQNILRGGLALAA